MLPALLLPVAVAAGLIPALPAPAEPSTAATAATAVLAAVSGTTRAAEAPEPRVLPTLDGSGDRARRLVAELLVDADSVDLAAADPDNLRFVLERQGAAYHLDVGMAADGRIQRAALRKAPRRDLGDGELSWLGIAIGDREKVVAAAVGDDGVVVIQLDDGTALPLTQAAGDDYVGC